MADAAITPAPVPAPANQHDAGRADYTALASFKQLEHGEPYFLIRARDALSGPAVRAWAALAYAAGAPPATVESALQQADTLDAYARKRLPDADHLSADQVLQLVFEFSRRAWDARDDASDPKVMLAEERGLNAAMGRLRPTLSLLFAGLEHNADGSWTFRMPMTQPPNPRPVSDACPIEALRRLSVVLRA